MRISRGVQLASRLAQTCDREATRARRARAQAQWVVSRFAPSRQAHLSVSVNYSSIPLVSVTCSASSVQPERLHDAFALQNFDYLNLNLRANLDDDFAAALRVELREAVRNECVRIGRQVDVARCNFPFRSSGLSPFSAHAFRCSPSCSPC